MVDAKYSGFLAAVLWLHVPDVQAVVLIIGINTMQHNAKQTPTALPLALI